MPDGTEFTGIAGKEDNLVRYTETFEKFLPVIIVPFKTFLPRFLVEWYAVRKFNNFEYSKF